MRKLLLTTALVSLAMVPAAKADMEVSLGGYTAFQAAAFDNDVANNSSRDFQSESEIHVKATGKADNGLEYGAYLELMTSTSDSVNSDESNLWLSGNWGKVELGDQDGASMLAQTAAYVGAGQVYGHYMDYVPAADRGHGIVEGPGDTSLKALDTNDATKITYYTPVFSGLQLGMSYAPERDSFADGEQVQMNKNVGNHDNAFEFGGQYNRDISGVAFKLGGEYIMAGAKTGSGVEDINAWAVTTQLGYKGFALGAGYTHDGDSGLTAGTANDDVTKWNAGLTYNATAWGLGVSYAHVDFDQAGTPFGVTGATGSGGTYSAWGVGGVYKIAPGLTASADLVFFDRNRDTGSDTDGYVALTEVRAAF